MTTKRHPENEKAKRNFLQFLRDVKGRDESSIDQVAKALERFDDYNRRRDFGKFHIQQARGFKAHLMAQRNITNRRALVGFDGRFDARHVESLFHLAFGRSRLLARQTSRRGIFQPAGQFGAGGDRAPAQAMRFAQTNPRRSRRHADGDGNRAARPGACRLHDPDGRARPGDCFIPAQGYRPRA